MKVGTSKAPAAFLSLSGSLFAFGLALSVGDGCTFFLGVLCMLFCTYTFSDE